MGFRRSAELSSVESGSFRRPHLPSGIIPDFNYLTYLHTSVGSRADPLLKGLCRYEKERRSARLARGTADEAHRRCSGDNLRRASARLLLRDGFGSRRNQRSHPSQLAPGRGTRHRRRGSRASPGPREPITRGVRRGLRMNARASPVGATGWRHQTNKAPVTTTPAQSKSASSVTMTILA